jgi:hypothetical protein
MRVRRSRVAVLVGAVALMAPIPLVAFAAGSTASSQWEGSAAADGVRTGVQLAGFLVVSDIVDAGGPATQAVVNSFGDSKAYAAFPYPGEIVLTAHGLSQGAAPNYPLIAQSNPTRPTDDVTQGPYSLHAQSADESSKAVAQAAAGGGSLAVATGRSTAEVVHDPDAGTVTADAESTLEGVSIAGVLRIGRMHSYAQVVSTPGEPAKRAADTEAADVEVAGQQVALTDKGLVLAGTDVPLPPDSTANAALSAAGITVRYLRPSGKGSSLVAPGFSISVVQDVPGVGRATVTYVLGQAAVTAQAAGADLTGLTGSGPAVTVPGGTTPASGGSTTGGTSGPVAAPSGADLTTGGGSPASAPVTASEPGAAPQVAGAYQPAAATASTASLYLVLAIGAVVMAGAAQLFRLLAVRLTWT